MTPLDGRLVCASCNPSGRTSTWGVRHADRPAKVSGCSSTAPKRGPATGSRVRFRAGPSPSSPEPPVRAASTSRATSPTTAGCSSTAPTRSCPRSAAARERGNQRRERAGRCRERLRVRARRRRQLHGRARLRDARLLGHIRSRIGVPGRQRRRRERVLPDGRRAGAPRHRQQPRHLRRTNLQHRRKRTLPHAESAALGTVCRRSLPPAADGPAAHRLRR